MVRKYTCVLVCLFISVSSMAQSDGKEKAVQEGLIQFFSAVSARDSMAMKRWATRDLTLIEYGTVWNMDTLVRKAVLQNTSADFSRTNRFEFLQTHVYGITAWVSYRLFSKIIRDGKETNLQWIESANLLFEDGRWKLRFLHSTLLNRKSP